MSVIRPLGLSPCSYDKPYGTCTVSDWIKSNDFRLVPAVIMADTTALYALRFPDGSVSLYIDEQYATERGVDPGKLVRVEIPRDLFVKGSVQDVREYVARHLETHHQRAGSA
jgi:hypothetical protein